MYPNPFDPDELPSEPVPEAQKILHGLLAELPDKALALINRVNAEIDKLEDLCKSEVAVIREEAEQRVAKIEDKAAGRRKTLLQHAIEQLEPMQKELFRSGELGKALATFVQIQILRGRSDDVMPDPGSLARFEQIGKAFHFRVTGRNQGPVWGTDIYTSDSHLATAAVHAGAVEVGEEGVVRVSIVNLSGLPVTGSFSNGVMSMDWGPYAVGYRVSRA